MIGYILCAIGGAVIGIILVAIVSAGNREEDYKDGFRDGYDKALKDSEKTPTDYNYLNNAYDDEEFRRIVERLW